MSSDRRRFFRDVAAAGTGWLMSGPASAAQDGRPLTCRVVDARSGSKVPARVRLVDARGSEVVPAGSADLVVEKVDGALLNVVSSAETAPGHRCSSTWSDHALSLPVLHESRIFT